MKSYSDEQLRIFLKATSSNLPFFNVCSLIAEYLKTLPFMQEYFKGAIFTYDRQDNPAMSLPAVTITPSSMSTRTTGFVNRGSIKIDIIRNISKSNRANINVFKLITAERLQDVLFRNADFTGILWRFCPYLAYFGDSHNISMDFREDTVRITCNMSYYFLMYRDFVDARGFYSEGFIGDVADIDRVGVTQFFPED